MEQLTSMRDMVGHYIQKKEEEKRIEEEKRLSAIWKIPVCYNDDDDEEKSLLNRNTSIDSSSKIDSLLDEFADNSSPRPLKDSNSDVSDAITESSLHLLPPVEDSDSIMEEIDLFLTLDDSMPPGIETNDYDSEGDILFFK
ncbi:hypothetical protein Tco_0268376 [Tanacetum coccineum]